ncbi:intraflagellar transport protein 74 homolog [Copidosoma floridanum]|uniref:intraflagellar transport protein 74 homolog n=1 Tax=Copidosoma floridanum TaxID=29053 RepID=UPI0006C9B040|nr:intraflagellar transport protein 74 homolog [Copidosoma floridanum]
MELDRPSVSRSGERPVTRWKREPESPQVFTDYPSTDPTSRPSSSFQRPSSGRPISRRGLKTDVSDFGVSRPPTSGNRRPPSPLLNRIPTATSRTGTPQARTSSGLPRNYVQIIDRPITQQGIGVRSGSARAPPPKPTDPSREIQDDRQQLVQVKMDNEVSRDYEHYEATTLVDPEVEARALEEVNDAIEDAEKRLEFKRQISEKFASGVDPDSGMKTELQVEIALMQEDLDDLYERRAKIVEKIDLSPMKQDILDISEKRKKSARKPDDDEIEADVDTAEKIDAQQQDLESLDESNGDETVSRPKTAKTGISDRSASRDYFPESESFGGFEKRNYDDLADKIKKNEAHRFISVLEDKLQKSGSELRFEETDDSSELTKLLVDAVSRYNLVLINNVKLVFL